MSKIDITGDVYVKAWSDFKGEDWKCSTNVADFVQHNYHPYDDDESFLSGPTQRTLEVNELMKATKDRYEKEGRFPMDTQPTSIAEIGPGYVDKDKDIIFGLQNDELFKLNFMPKGGIRMAETALIEHGYEPDPLVHEIYTKHTTTVNDGIFRAYSNDIRRARHSGLITGLPDALVA